MKKRIDLIATKPLPTKDFIAFKISSQAVVIVFSSIQAPGKILNKVSDSQDRPLWH